MADRNNGIVLPVFQFAPAEHEHFFTLVPRAYVPCLSVDDFGQIACDSTSEANKPRDVTVVMAALGLPRSLLPLGESRLFLVSWRVSLVICGGGLPPYLVSFAPLS